MKEIYLILTIALTTLVIFEGKSYSQDSFSINRPIKSNVQLVDYYNYLGDLDTLSFEDKIAHLTKLFHSSKKLNNDSITGLTANDLGDAFSYNDSIPAAYYYHNLAYSFISKVDYKILAGDIIYKFGNFYFKIEEHEKAIEYYFESIEYYKEYDPPSISYSLGNICELYYQLGDYENTIKYTLENSAHTNKLSGANFFYNHGYDCNILSKCYGQLNQMDSSIFYLKKAFIASDSVDFENESHNELILFIHTNAIIQYIKNNELLEAKKSLAIIENLNIKSYKFEVHISRARYLLATKNRVAFFNKIENFPITESKYETKKLLLLKIQAYEQFGLFKKAIKAYKDLEQNKKEINIERKRKYTAYSIAKFEDIKKKHQINDLEKQQKLSQLTIQKQKAYGFASIAGIVTLLSAVLLLYFRSRQNQRYNTVLKNEVAAQTSFLQKLNNDLESKNDELNRFNHALSHDLKEPLRSIVSFSGLLSKNIDADSKLQMYAKYIIDSGKQLSHMISDIQEFQQSDFGEITLEETDLNNIIQNLKQKLKPLLTEKNVTIHSQILPKLQSASKESLATIFKNLIKNGIKYNKSEQPKIDISYEDHASDIHILVKDNGIGISEEYFDQIFLMFKRLNNRSEYTGSGLGLATSRKLARQMKGDIQILQSKSNEGTTFLLTIPK